MSLGTNYSNSYYGGGYGELANPSQWPQLRKKRRLVALTQLYPPNPNHPFSSFGTPPHPIRPTIRSETEPPCRRPSSDPSTPLQQTPLLPKVRNYSMLINLLLLLRRACNNWPNQFTFPSLLGSRILQPARSSLTSSLQKKNFTFKIKLVHTCFFHNW